MAKLVVFDTNICVWGILNRSDRDNLISRCSALIQTLDKEGYEIAVPAPVLGELLSVVPPDEQPRLYDTIGGVTQIYAFDVFAAELYGQMLFDHFNKKYPEDLKKYAKDNHIPRQKVKIDYQIVAVAKSIGAECIYSNDAGLRKFAEPHITVQDVPSKLMPDSNKILVQAELFAADDYIKTFDGKPPMAKLIESMQPSVLVDPKNEIKGEG